METLTTQIETAMPAVVQAQAAADILTAAIDVVRPGLRALTRRRPLTWNYDRLGLMLRRRQCHDGSIILTGVGEREHPRAQYAVTGRVSGWAYVLRRDGSLARRTYRGTHSDFPDYCRVTWTDSPATPRDVVSWSTAGPISDLEDCLAALRDATEAIAGMSAAAQRRADKLCRIAELLARQEGQL
jgi:hypothetical protein